MILHPIYSVLYPKIKKSTRCLPNIVSFRVEDGSNPARLAAGGYARVSKKKKKGQITLKNTASPKLIEDLADRIQAKITAGVYAPGLD